MKSDLSSAVRPVCLSRSVAKFLDKCLSDDQVSTLVEYLDIRNMKNNPAVNHADRHQSGAFLEGESFVRKGRAGGWREEMTEQQSREMEEWVRDRAGEGGLPCKWE